MTEEINEMINKFCDSVEKRINQYELEKENAELKDYSQRMENQRENYYKEYLRLKQENKELKEETLQWKKIKDMANNNKYRSALEEIRELVEKSIKISYNLEVNSMLYDIIYKINEVLGEDTES